MPSIIMPSRRTFARAVLALALALSLSLGQAARAQQRPPITEDVDVLEPGALRVQAGIDFMQDAKFPLSGLTGDLTRVGVVGVNVGLAPNVEVQLDGVAQNFLSINSRSLPSPIPLDLPSAGSTNDFGDFTLSTKIKLRNETRLAPSLGFRFGVQLPNSNQTRGIGASAGERRVRERPARLPREVIEQRCTGRHAPRLRQ